MKLMLIFPFPQGGLHKLGELFSERKEKAKARKCARSYVYPGRLARKEEVTISGPLAN